VYATVSDQKLGVDDGVYNAAGTKTSSTADGALDYYTADVKNYADYYPFGSLEPNRHGGETGYRYGFNGMEMDDEVKDLPGTSYNFKYRVHDPRVGRFLSLDPLSKEYPWNSPYAFAENKVIRYVELEGLEIGNPFKYEIKTTNDAIAEGMSRGVPFANEADEKSFLRRQERIGVQREVAKDILLITGGVVTIAVSGGSGAVVVAGVLSGSFAVAAGSAALVIDLAGNTELANSIPNGYLDATVGLMVEYTVDGEKVKVYTRATLAIAEGQVTAQFQQAPKRLLEAIDKGLTATNMSITVVDQIKTQQDSNGQSNNSVSETVKSVFKKVTDLFKFDAPSEGEVFEGTTGVDADK
jgi:RHS repeat-associated protein